MNKTVSLIRLAHRRRRSRSFQAADHHELAVSARRAGRGAPREGHRRGAKRPWQTHRRKSKVNKQTKSAIVRALLLVNWWRRKSKFVPWTERTAHSGQKKEQVWCVFVKYNRDILIPVGRQLETRRRNSWPSSTVEKWSSSTSSPPPRSRTCCKSWTLQAATAWTGPVPLSQRRTCLRLHTTASPVSLAPLDCHIPIQNFCFTNCKKMLLVSQNFVGDTSVFGFCSVTDLPIARRNSLHRFLEKRKDR